MKPVLTKADFVRRYSEGEFGNRSPTWAIPEDLLFSGYSDKVHLRSRHASGPTEYNLEPWWAYNRWILKDRPEDWYCSAMAPHDRNVLQGEVQRLPGGLYLYYSAAPGLPMRDALAKSARSAKGFTAKLLVDYAMNTASREWLDYLLDEYDDHVVEFSSFSVCWGTVPRHNTCFWEIRKY